MESRLVYRNFVRKLLRNYVLGSILAVLGVGGTLIFSTLTVSRPDTILLMFTLLISLGAMFIFEFLVFRSQLLPIRNVFSLANPPFQAYESAYLQTHKLPALSVRRILGPHWLAFLIPGAGISIFEIEQRWLSLPLSDVALASFGTLIVAMMHALVEFFLTTQSIEPVLTYLQQQAEEKFSAKISLKGIVLVSVQRKFLLSIILIGTLPLLLFTLATSVRIAGEGTKNLVGYYQWAAIMLIIGVLFASVGAWLLAHDVTQPISSLEQVMSQVERGHLAVHASDLYSDEFSRLISGFNLMVQGLNQRDQTNRQLMDSYFATLSAALDARDPYTAGHSARVAAYAFDIGRQFGMNEQDLALLRQSALLHDIGKIGIRDDVLLKTGKLNDDEYNIIKQHPVIGELIIRQVQPESAMKPLLPGIRWHHERYDGKGYPDGLQGENIPLFGRIIAVADAYDAMTSNRTYRQGMDPEQARAILIAGRGTQWDPVFVDYFTRINDETVVSARFPATHRSV